VGPFPALTLALVLALTVPPAFACEVPDEGSNTPWHRAVAKVKYRPETEAMSDMMARNRNVVQYVVSLDEPRRLAGRCWWPVEVRVEGRLWKRFLVTPDGKGVREDKPR
jgi:hypothetical protein